MTVVLLESVNRYIGVSSDTKPTSPPAGSTFFETDTLNTYVYSGSAWGLQLGGNGTFRTSKTLVLDGTAGKGLSATSGTLFAVTGDVIIEYLLAICEADCVTVNGTMALGVTSSTSLFVAATDSNVIDAGELWGGTSPPANGFAVPAALKQIWITQDILVTFATANTTSGTITFYVIWRPITAGALVAAAA